MVMRDSKTMLSPFLEGVGAKNASRSDTVGVDVVMRDSKTILSPLLEGVGAKNASRVWAYMAKFVALDRFLKTLRLAQVFPGVAVPKVESLHHDHLGTASKVCVSQVCFFTFIDWISDTRGAKPSHKGGGEIPENMAGSREEPI